MSTHADTHSSSWQGSRDKVVSIAGPGAACGSVLQPYTSLGGLVYRPNKSSGSDLPVLSQYLLVAVSRRYSQFTNDIFQNEQTSDTWCGRMNGLPETAPVQPDYEWCHQSLQEVSRTFSLTVDLLEKPMSDQICLGYLLCRIADTIEDANHIPPAEQTTLLETYGAALDPATSTDIDAFVTSASPWIPDPENRSADWTVVAEAPTIFATYHDLPADVRAAITPPVQEMIDGMAGFVDRHADYGGLRITDRNELERYCYYVAGTVGKLITNLLARTGVSPDVEETMRSNSEDFGLLLQLTNVSKDVYDDYVEENNVYLPAEWLEDEGINQDVLLDPEYRDRSARVVSRTTSFARWFLDDAQAYLEAMPTRGGNTLAAWLVPYLLSVGTLRELDRRPADALTDRPVKVSREEVFAILAAARNAHRDRIEALRGQIERAPFHQRPDDWN